MDKINKFRLNHKYLKSSNLRIGHQALDNKTIDVFYINSSSKYYNTLIRHFTNLYCHTKSDFTDLNEIEENFKVGRTYLIFVLENVHNDLALFYNERLGFFFELNYPYLTLWSLSTIRKVVENYLLRLVPDLKIYIHPHDGDMFFKDEEYPNENLQYPHNGEFEKTFSHILIPNRVYYEYRDILKVEIENLKPLGYGLTFF